MLALNFPTPVANKSIGSRLKTDKFAYVKLEFIVLDGTAC